MKFAHSGLKLDCMPGAVPRYMSFETKLEQQGERANMVKMSARFINVRRSRC
jgi:hypothetical protein